MTAQASPRPARLQLAHGDITLPAFLPDATRGMVRAVDPADLEACGVEGLMMNVFHLLQRPGAGTIKALGGLHRAFGWLHPIITDSGGFQAYSLIRQNPKRGSLSDRGLVYRPEGSGHKLTLTPEKSVQTQFLLGADVVVCLDDCTHADEPLAEQRESVRRTVLWAARSRRELDRLLDSVGDRPRPLLMAVVQGGADLALRRQCAERLLEIGFDAYGLGGWPLDAEGGLLREVVAALREFVPERFALHALGVGHPEYVAVCARLGYDLFDSALPTRDARRGRLLQGRTDDEGARYVYIGDAAHVRADAPVDAACDCLACRRYSRAYLHHLFKVGDVLYQRLATIHNLRYMVRLMARLAEERRG